MKNVFTVLILFIGLIAQAQVTAYQPDDLIECDDDTDGIAVFDLTQTYEQILFDQDPLEHLIFFYETQMDADLNINPIVNDIAYTNVSNPQTIYVRVEHATTSEYDTTFFDLIVNHLPDATAEVSDEIYCQVPFTGVDYIILDSKSNEVLNGQNPTVFDVFYFESQVDALLFDNYLDSTIPYFFDTTERTIYIGIINVVTGCYIAAQDFILLVAVGNFIDQEPNDIYIDEGDNDGSAIFDLTIYEALMLGDQDASENIFSYHHSIEDAENVENAINNPDTYQNVSNPESIFVRLSNTNENCFQITSFEIETDGILSNDSFNIENLSILPNPASETIQVQSTYFSSETQVVLYNIQGQVVFSEVKISETGSFTINVSNLPSGIYFVQIQSEGVIVTKKLIKQ